MKTENLDSELIRLLRDNARLSVSELARQLGVSRATVQDHMQQLEHRNIIRGYTIRFEPEHSRQQVKAYVMVSLEPKAAVQVIRMISTIDAVETLHTISGQYDLIAYLSTDTTEQLDDVIDRIGDIEGVFKTMTSVVLSEKFRR